MDPVPDRFPNVLKLISRNVKLSDIGEKIHTIAANIFSCILLSSVFALAVYQASPVMYQGLTDVGTVQTLNKKGETASVGVAVVRCKQMGEHEIVMKQ